MRKNYILDANILLHDPHSIFQFADNTVIIPIAVIGEIDRFKKEMSDRGYNARAVARLLDALRGERSLAEGIDLQSGGRLRIDCSLGDGATNGMSGADGEILRVARAVQDGEPATPVIIVTKDINLRIRADAVGLRAEDYETDRVPIAEVYGAQHDYQLPVASLAEFKQTGRIPLPEPGLRCNEYVLLRADDGSRTSALARVSAAGDALIALREPDESMWGVRPRNKEQYYASDALLDEDIRLVTLMGKAGTGKTLLAIAAAIHQAFRMKRYRCALIARPIFPLGRDLGYLPGDVGQKLDPWMKPVFDTVEFLLDAGGPVQGRHDGHDILNSGLIEIQPLTYIRGRNISNRFVVIDEAQNLAPLEIKTVITRIGQGAKIVLTGDPYQIDNPYVDSGSNGFSYLSNRFRGQPIAAHVELVKGERSELAELAANLL